MEELLLITAYLPWVRHQVDRLLTRAPVSLRRLPAAQAGAPRACAVRVALGKQRG